jgi:hypothetical protein
MSQQRITLFFPCVSRKKTSPDTRCYFLELPATIRRRIYHEAGLVSNRIIHLNYWRLRRNRDLLLKGYFTFENTLLPALPPSLLAVCRAIHDEVRKVLYGENKIIISATAPQGLRALERMSQATLREIQLLVVRLNVSSCPRTCCGGRGYRCGNGRFGCSDLSSHDAPLSSGANQLTISQWHRICTKLAGSIQAKKLALYVTCDCADRTTAQMINEPLLSLPALRDCGLRLAMYPDQDLTAMAEDTVRYLTRRSQPPPLLPFRFMDLPKEIQLHILGYASTVPVAEIICTQQKLRYWTPCETRWAIMDPATGIIDASLKGCFCSAAHSAFNFSCPCSGSASPFSMFLVSRDFRDCAMESFYGQNAFTVVMEGPRSSRQNSTAPSLSSDDASDDQPIEMQPDIAIVAGLIRFPPQSLSYLTSLNLLFESPETEYLLHDQLGWHNWLETIDTLSRAADLPALTIQLRMRESYYPEFDDAQPPVDPAHEARMLRTHETLVRPMKALRGLKNLFVHLNWETSTGFPDGRRGVEQRLERIVMGPTYDAWARGKTIRYQRDWQEVPGEE